MRQETQRPATLIPAVGRRDHVEGWRDAPITLVEYGDFQCGHCLAAFPILARVRSLMGHDLRIAFRHFPQPKAHPQAQVAAEAAEAVFAQAGEAGFWTMHDALFSQSPDRLREPDLVALAERFELDALRVRRELASGVHADRVHDDARNAVRSGANGTPTFFANGVRIDEPWGTARELEKVIRRIARETER